MCLWNGSIAVRRSFSSTSQLRCLVCSQRYFTSLYTLSAPHRTAARQFLWRPDELCSSFSGWRRRSVDEEELIYTYIFSPSKSATACVQAILVISELCKDLWRGGGVSCIIQFQNKIRQHDGALAGYIAWGGSGYMFCCADSTMTRLMRHFQPAAVLTHPPRSAFLLPGNRDTLSLSSTMSVNAGWIISCPSGEASRFGESHSKDQMGILD